MELTLKTKFPLHKNEETFGLLISLLIEYWPGPGEVLSIFF